MNDAVALLIGHGSTCHHQEKVIRGLVNIVKHKGVFADVFYAFMRFNRPKLSDVLTEIVKKGFRRIIAIPIFIAEGSHTLEDIPDMLGIPRGARYCKKRMDDIEIEIFYARPLGIDDKIAEVLIKRGLELLNEEFHEGKDP